MKKTVCGSISPHLVSGNLVVQASSRPQEGIPLMKNGNVPLDGDALKINEADLPKFKGCPWLKRLVGGEELLNGRKRWVLWLKDVPMEEIKRHPETAKRVELCAKLRTKMKKGLECPDPRTFRDTYSPDSFLAVPMVFSESRPYVIASFFDGGFIPTNQVQTVPDAEMYHFGVISSAMHKAWVSAIAGRLDSRIRYSRSMCWNTFPWPNASKQERDNVSAISRNILQIREECGGCLSDLYDLDRMPDLLKDAHKKLDCAVDGLYRKAGFASDMERLEHLFSLHVEPCLDLWC